MTDARAAFAVRSIAGDALDDVTISETATIAEATSTLDRRGEGIALVCRAGGAPASYVGDAETRQACLRRLDGSQPVAAIASTDLDVVSSAEPPTATVERLRATGREVSVRVEAGRAVEARVLVAADDVAPLEALVLAGGLGLRMRPLTEELPKPLVEIAGKPMLDHVLEHLSRHGVADVTLATNYLAERVEAHVGDGARFGLRVRSLRESKRMGTAGALSLLRPRPSRPLLVVNADVLTRLDVRAMARHHRRAGATMTLAVHPYAVEVPYGIARLVGSRVVDLREKPRLTHWANAGVYVVSPAALSDVPPDTYVDMTTLIDRLIARGDPVEAFPVREYWHDAGTPADVEKASREIASSPAGPGGAVP